MLGDYVAMILSGGAIVTTIVLYVVGIFKRKGTPS